MVSALDAHTKLSHQRGPKPLPRRRGIDKELHIENLIVPNQVWSFNKKIETFVRVYVGNYIRKAKTNFDSNLPRDRSRAGRNTKLASFRTCLHACMHMLCSLLYNKAISMYRSSSVDLTDRVGVLMLRLPQLQLCLACRWMVVALRSLCFVSVVDSGATN